MVFANLLLINSPLEQFEINSYSTYPTILTSSNLDIYNKNIVFNNLFLNDYTISAWFSFGAFVSIIFILVVLFKFSKQNSFFYVFIFYILLLISVIGIYNYYFYETVSIVEDLTITPQDTFNNKHIDLLLLIKGYQNDVTKLVMAVDEIYSAQQEQIENLFKASKWTVAEAKSSSDTFYMKSLSANRQILDQRFEDPRLFFDFLKGSYVYKESLMNDFINILAEKARTDKGDLNLALLLDQYIYLEVLREKIKHFSEGVSLDAISILTRLYIPALFDICFGDKDLADEEIAINFLTTLRSNVLFDTINPETIVWNPSTAPYSSYIKHVLFREGYLPEWNSFVANNEVVLENATGHRRLFDVLHANELNNKNSAETNDIIVKASEYFYKFNIQKLNFIMTFDILFCFVFFYIVIYYLSKNSLSNNTNTLIPNLYQMISEFLYKVSLNLFTSILGKSIQNQEFFIKINSIFIFLIISNVQGMIPYMSTLTSALTNTFFMALAIFISILINIFDKKGFNYFLNLFLPEGSPIALIFLLIPIEVLSYSFRVVSLSVRLFANMMAGHTLLKVIVGFSWTMIYLGDFMIVANLLPVLTLFILTLLEFGVALIQAYIFTILACIYLKDIFVGH